MFKIKKIKVTDAGGAHVGMVILISSQGIYEITDFTFVDWGSGTIQVAVGFLLNPGPEDDHNEVQLFLVENFANYVIQGTIKVLSNDLQTFQLSDEYKQYNCGTRA